MVADENAQATAQSEEESNDESTEEKEGVAKNEAENQATEEESTNEGGEVEDDRPVGEEAHGLTCNGIQVGQPFGDGWHRLEDEGQKRPAGEADSGWHVQGKVHGRYRS